MFSTFNWCVNMRCDGIYDLNQKKSNETLILWSIDLLCKSVLLPVTSLQRLSPIHRPFATVTRSAAVKDLGMVLRDDRGVHPDALN